MIKQIAKKIIKDYLDYRFHAHSKEKAAKILKDIESVKGRTNPKFIKFSNEYARDVLGWIGYSHWLYVYSAVSDNFKEGWIPDNYYDKIVVPALKGNYGDISNLKALVNMIFEKNVFPDILYYVNGLWVTNNYKIITENKVKELLFKESKNVVFKVDNSKQGRGVYFFDVENFEISRVQLLGNGVFQEFINQHIFFEELMPDSVATIRCTTVIDDQGKVSVRACYLRLGRENDTHVRSGSHIRIPIHIKNGELYEFGYTTKWLTVNAHPDTNTIFKDKIIPHFDMLLTTSLKLHKEMPFARTIGWDMIIDKNNNIKVMEWNGQHNDIKFSEATQGPCFADLNWETLWKNRI
jgi:hypothetical protein